MCLGLPQRVVSMDGYVAVCEAEGRRHRIHMGLVGPQPPGAWVLTFLGDARCVLDEETARRMLQARQALRHIRGGGADIDAWFPDLANREPQLPDALRPRAAPLPPPPEPC